MPPKPIRQTWLIGDSDRASDRFKRRAVAFGQGGSASRDLPHPRRRSSPEQLGNDGWGLKGDAWWLQEGQPTALVQCSCPQCGGAFAGRPETTMSGRQRGLLCERCSDQVQPSASGAAELLWRSTLHTDVPRAIHRPGKVAERPRCTLCGALEPHVCQAKDEYPAFDSPSERRLVGFVDRGLRRYHPETKSAAHHSGLTSGPWEARPEAIMQSTNRSVASTGSKVRLSPSALRHGREKELLRKGTPFASPAASTASSHTVHAAQRADNEVGAMQEHQRRDFKPEQRPQNQRLARWEARREKFLARPDTVHP